MPETLKNYVGGGFLAAAGDPFDDINPSDANDLVARVPGGNADDAAAAVRAAGQALAAWRDLPGPARAEFLYRWAEVIAARGEELAQAMVREVGKPLG
jgi:aldehyde dehydrogenase (NAD+)